MTDIVVNHLTGVHYTAPGIDIEYPSIGAFDPYAHTNELGDPLDPSIGLKVSLVMAGFATGSGPDGSPQNFYGLSLEPCLALKGSLSRYVRVNALIGEPAQSGLIVLCNSTDIHFAGTTKAYVLFLDTFLSGTRIRLCQMNTGVSTPHGSGPGSTYTMVAETLNGAWSPLFPVLLTLKYHVEPRTLKGVHLQAFANHTLLFDVVHAGGGAYVPATGEVKGHGMYTQTITNSIVSYFLDPEDLEDGEEVATS